MATTRATFANTGVGVGGWVKQHGEKNGVRGRQMVCVLGGGIRDPVKLMFPDLQERFYLTTSCLVRILPNREAGSCQMRGHLCQEPGRSGWGEPGASGKQRQSGSCLACWGSRLGLGPR